MATKITYLYQKLPKYGNVTQDDLETAVKTFFSFDEQSLAVLEKIGQNVRLAQNANKNYRPEIKTFLSDAYFSAFGDNASFFETWKNTVEFLIEITYAKSQKRNEMAKMMKKELAFVDAKIQGSMFKTMEERASEWKKIAAKSAKDPSYANALNVNVFTPCLGFLKQAWEIK